jgi:hypothetical protein
MERGLKVCGNCEHRGPIVDTERSACLCSAGGGPYVAATLITPDGRQDLVLVDWDKLGNPDYTYNADVPHATHAQPGPLPGYWTRRVAAVQEWHNIVHEAGRMLAAEHRTPHRCGRPTKTTGAPCQTPVARPGGACSWHRSAQQ